MPVRPSIGADLAAMADPLFAVWSTIQTAIIAQVELKLACRLRRDREYRQRVRQYHVQSLREALIASQPTALERVNSPDVHRFTNLPSVRPFWEPDQPDGYVVDQARWLAARTDVLVDVEAWRTEQSQQRARKMLEAMAAADALSTLKTPLFEAEGTSIAAPDASATSPRVEDEQGGAARPNALPLHLAPPAILEESLINNLCGSFLTRSICTSYHSLHSYPQVLLHEHDAHHGSSYNSRLSVAWIKSLSAILEHAGLDASTVAEQNLEALGAVFECRSCTRQSQAAEAHAAGGATAKPPGLSWRELVRRLLLFQGGQALR